MDIETNVAEELLGLPFIKTDKSLFKDKNGYGRMTMTRKNISKDHIAQFLLQCDQEEHDVYIYKLHKVLSGGAPEQLYNLEYVVVMKQK